MEDPNTGATSPPQGPVIVPTDSLPNQTVPQPTTFTPAVASTPAPDLSSAPVAPTEVPMFAQPNSISMSTPPSSSGKRSITLIIAAVLLSLGFGLVGYLLGSKHHAAAPMIMQATTTEEPLKIPTGATVIAQCSKGRGTQYVLPKDIPTGPVYNVFEGKVIGVEFMVGKDDLLATGKNFLNLPLLGKKYDHVNIGLLSQGHAGFPEPHYHVDVMMVPDSVASKITCT